ncbi:MAG: arginine--tRNA ligase [Gammaproteobacteria bacterium]|nr:arginine--tRNA ligase [Gammaproteobacteria bacterium]
MKTIKSELSEHIVAAVVKLYGDDYCDLDPLIQPTTNSEFGDYQANLAMSLAKKLEQKPREIAHALLEELDMPSICDKIEIAGPGFINLYLKNTFVNQRLETLANSPEFGVTREFSPETIVIDYSAPNIAKEMHVGHLRSTVIGDAAARIFTKLGHKVIRQNHMGDWGTQFGMLIEFLVDGGWTEQDSQDSLADIEQRYRDSKLKFDSDPEFNQRARQRVVALQSGDDYTLKLWNYLVRESTQHFMEIYQRLGVLLTETDNCPESFYNPMLAGTVQELADKSMLETSDGAEVIFLDGFKDRDERPLPMIVRKSDGGYLYSTTDLAAVRYRCADLGANRIIYITDARQAQHFAMLFAAVRKAGWASTEVRLDHMPFGSVLGADRKPFKTREGGTVRLIDLLDEAEKRAEVVLQLKNPELPVSERKELAKTISLAALKYADLSNDRIKDYVFDWDRMLALDGNTAPYLQNAYVRILSIFRKGEIDRGSVRSAKFELSHPAEKALALKLFQYSAAIYAVVDRLEPHRLCTYLYELAALFHAFYEACPILKEETPESIRKSRLALSDLCARILKDGLDILGIETVERM